MEEGAKTERGNNPMYLFYFIFKSPSKGLVAPQDFIFFNTILSTFIC
jgi:hypothetical protein